MSDLKTNELMWIVRQDSAILKRIKNWNFKLQAKLMEIDYDLLLKIRNGQCKSLNEKVMFHIFRWYVLNTPVAHDGYFIVKMENII